MLQDSWSYKSTYEPTKHYNDRCLAAVGLVLRIFQFKVNTLKILHFGIPIPQVMKTSGMRVMKDSLI